jgi:drug/metabolite transporter (DMT)-like permease
MPFVQTIKSNQTLQGILWMILSGFIFVCVTGIVRYMGSDVPAAQAAFIRYVFGLILIAPTLWHVYKTRLNKQQHFQLGARGFVHAMAIIFWFYAMARIPIAEVTAIGYTSPIFITIGAAIFLGEKFKLRRVMAVLSGFLGALIILRPGFHEIGYGQLAQLIAAPLFAASFIFTKKLTGKVDTITIVAMLSVYCPLFLAPFAFWVWEPPTLSDYALLFSVALFATLGHYTMTQAFKCAPITVTQPIGILQLVWASIMGLVLFHEAIDPWVLIGGGIIVGSATYISHREATMAQKSITPPATATKV